MQFIAGSRKNWRYNLSIIIKRWDTIKLVPHLFALERGLKREQYFYNKIIEEFLGKFIFGRIF